MNLVQDLTAETMVARSLRWDHLPETWEPLPGGGLRVSVPPVVDYFRDPAGIHFKDDAPYLWLKVTGDFVARAHVRPAFTSTWDAGALMARHDEQSWAKLCFEKTDLGPTAAVSVVTRGESDDANGANLSSPAIWLQIARAGDVFAMHYALEEGDWRMVRLFKLPVPSTIQVGLVAQCPIGPGTTVDFLSFSVEPTTVQNLRAGV